MNTIAASNEKRGEVSASRIALAVKNGRFRRAKRGDALPALGLRVPNLK